jgi:hypothetical protein
VCDPQYLSIRPTTSLQSSILKIDILILLIKIYSNLIRMATHDFPLSCILGYVEKLTLTEVLNEAAKIYPSAHISSCVHNRDGVSYVITIRYGPEFCYRVKIRKTDTGIYVQKMYEFHVALRSNQA